MPGVNAAARIAWARTLWPGLKSFRAKAWPGINNSEAPSAAGGSGRTPPARAMSRDVTNRGGHTNGSGGQGTLNWRTLADRCRVSECNFPPLSDHPLCASHVLADLRRRMVYPK